MGVSNSKTVTCEPLRLCKERKKYIKQAIDSRYSLAAAHVGYIQSLQDVGIALRKFAETEVSLESGSSLPDSLSNTRLNFMTSNAVGVVTVNVDPSNISNSNSNSNMVYVDGVESPSLPPPRLSWDYFNPTDGSFRLMGYNRFHDNLNDTEKELAFEGYVTPPEEVIEHCDDHLTDSQVDGCDLVCKDAQIGQCDLKDDCLTEEETEDSSELITRDNSKEFISSVKDIEDHFIRASKSGNEVSRMLEVNKIQVSYSEAKGSSTGSSLSLLACFRGEPALVLHEPPQTEKVVTWKRPTSLNSSLPHPTGTPSNDYDEKNFTEEFCMISGSHSSTLERLYAWERKLYDEVKASECLRKEYDRKCDKLRHQFTKDLKPHLIDKTRAATKDLHSRMKVALHTVDSISKRIEKIRDEELQPQLVEFIQGLIRMWESMLQCHRAQHITISSAYNSYIPRTKNHVDEPKNHIMSELLHETERFGSSFSDMVKSYTSYVESINSWLQNCIVLPKERVKGRRVFSPTRAVAPMIFVVFRDWSTGLRNLPSQKLSDAIKTFVSHIRLAYVEENESKERSLIENGAQTKQDGSNLSMIHSSMTKVLDRMTKFSEDSVKMYRDIKEKSEMAGNVYLNYRAPNRGFSI